MQSAAGLREHEVAHHFDDLEQEFESIKLGMWLFMASEIMMFGALIVGCYILLNNHTAAYLEASHHLNWKLGALNTFFLFTAGLTMALAAYQAQRSNQTAVRLLLVASILFASGFLVVKGIEYAAKFEHGLLPGHAFKGHGFANEHAHLFFGMYFMATGLHALHVLIGMGLMIWCLLVSFKVKFTRNYYVPIEMAGIYWALVDLVWVFLFPTLYLLG